LKKGQLKENTVSEIRQDLTTKEWVIIATERKKRPSDFVHGAPKIDRPSFVASCPFCPGNESMTPSPTLTQVGAADSWQVRVFGNRFPAVASDGTDRRKRENGFFLSMGGVGFHEVIVETPEHNKSLALMKDTEIAAVLHAYQSRYQAMAQTGKVKSIIIFKNHGPFAGTSLEHPHSQLVATQVVPRHMRIQYEVATSYFDDNGSCLYSDLAAREAEAGKRVIMDTKSCTVFHPFASHRPFETWIMPKANQANFGAASSSDLIELASVLRTTLLKLYLGLDDPDFNLVIDSAPVGEERADFYQWHMRIIPRITEVAGFEIGSGIYINTALPEETAEFMRDLQV
jgi:UDPglucose--hexose-1-phosphate uridylyltransferase